VIYVGIDPGASGAIACIAHCEAAQAMRISHIDDLPRDEEALFKRLDYLAQSDSTFSLERLPRHTGSSERMTAAQSASLHRSGALIHGFLRARVGRERLRLRAPQSWQHRFRDRLPRKASLSEARRQTLWKSALHQVALAEFPGAHILKNQADSALIALDLFFLLNPQRP